ncbi:hypothetical protein FGRMN_8676 [Fusarium graminum]|nr:hypothetical protein FGRMN_8676 [Fusarium graminum]
MAAKSQSSPTYQPLPREDPSVALLAPSERDDQEDGKTPVFKLSFSPTVVIRLLMIPLIITDIVFLCMPQRLPGVAAVFAIGAFFLLFWHAYRIFKCFLPGRKSHKFDLKIGSFFCTFGTSSLGSGASKRMLSCFVSLVDFSFGLLFIGPSFLAIRSGIWRDYWSYHYDTTPTSIAGLSITIIILQSVVAVINLIPVLRKIKIAVYLGDEEESGRIQLSDEQFHDEESEPRDSMTSEV